MFVQCQTIDSFCQYIAGKTNPEKQKTSARAGKIIEVALYRYPLMQSQKHNTAQSILVIGYLPLLILLLVLLLTSFHQYSKIKGVYDSLVRGYRYSTISIILPAPADVFCFSRFVFTAMYRQKLSIVWH